MSHKPDFSFQALPQDVWNHVEEIKREEHVGGGAPAFEYSIRDFFEAQLGVFLLGVAKVFQVVLYEGFVWRALLWRVTWRLRPERLLPRPPLQG
jgi:hypothetical protein